LVGTNSSLVGLSTPTANTDKTAAASGESITLTVSNLDPNASGVEWNISGNYTIVSGTLTSEPLVIKSDTPTTIQASVKAKGDGVNYTDSSFSNTVTISVSGTGSTWDTSLVDGETKEGNSLTDPNAVGTFWFNKKTFDGSTPPDVMFFSVNGTLVKIDFATETLYEKCEQNHCT
jgi:hypothetical protein